MTRRLSVRLSFCILILVGLIVIQVFVIPVSAAEDENILGWVYYSDIEVFLDGYPIRSYNINGYTYIIVEDLLYFGYDVKWDEKTFRLRIGFYPDNAISPYRYTTLYMSSIMDKRPGNKAFPYYSTDVVTSIEGWIVTGFNIGGYTCICLDDLARFCAYTYEWNESERVLSMVSLTSSRYEAYKRYGLGTPYCLRNAVKMTELAKDEKIIQGRWEGFFFPPESEGMEVEQISDGNVATEEWGAIGYAALTLYWDRTALLEIDGERFELTNWHWIDTISHGGEVSYYEYRAEFDEDTRLEFMYSMLEMMVATITEVVPVGGIMMLFYIG